MNLFFKFFLIAALAAPHVDGSPHCTRGRLFVSATATAHIHMLDLDSTGGPSSSDTTIEAFGPPGQFLKTSRSNRIVSSINRGTESNFWQDGGVSFIRAGVSPSSHVVGGFATEKEAPSLITDFSINCTRPIHYVAHAQKLAFFCDGSFEANVNSTVWVVDERTIEQGSDALAFTRTLSGSHHGVSVPIDDNRVLISIAKPERVARDTTASSLPDGFEVYDYDGNVIHGLNEVDDPSKSCLGFHGSGVTDGTFAFACDQNHGGLLILDYDSSTAVAYVSRSLSYPEQYANHRTGSLESHQDSDVIIGNFADRASESFHLVAFNPQTDDTINEKQILELTAAHCAFQFELSAGKLFLVWMPTGNLLIYALDPEWMLVANVQAISDMNECAGTIFTAGHGHAYLAQGNRLVDVDFVDLASIKVINTELEFMANSLAVAGVVEGFECEGPPIPDVRDPLITAATGWVVLHHEIQDVLIPGSTEQAKALLLLRKDIGEALNIPLNRIYIGEVRPLDTHAAEEDEEHDHDKEDLDIAFKIMFSNPSISDGNQATGEELLAQFKTLVEDKSSALFMGAESSKIVGTVSAEAPSHDEYNLTDAATKNDGLSGGAIAGFSILGIFAALAILVAGALYQRNRKVTTDLEKAHFELEAAKGGQAA